MADVRIGISGWTYAPWRGAFYPKELPQKRELEYASRALNSIEINGTFYSLQRPESFEKWHDETPDVFVFTLKGGRFITHLKRLKDVEVPLANFWASGVLALKEKLGPILWQFPPGFKFDEGKFASFFELLPRTTKEAAKIAKKHDVRMEGRTWTKVDADRPMRHAVEIRDESFRDERFYALLRKHEVALVVADTAGKWPMIEELTSDFIYARLHGDEQLYVSGYTDAALDDWAKRMKAWRKRGLDVFAYFDNDVKVRSPFDAMNLAARVNGGEAKPPPAELLKGVTETARTSWPGFGKNKPSRASRPKPPRAKTSSSGRTKRRPRA